MHTDIVVVQRLSVLVKQVGSRGTLFNSLGLIPQSLKEPQANPNPAETCFSSASCAGTLTVTQLSMWWCNWLVRR